MRPFPPAAAAAFMAPSRDDARLMEGSVVPQTSSTTAKTPALRAGRDFSNLAPAALIEHAIRGADSQLAASGALVVRTGPYTGRSPEDKFIVSNGLMDDKIWWGDVNHPL